MRRMTIETFLKKYLCDLSGLNSLSIHKLAILANRNERIRNVLILYCSLEGKLRILVKYLKMDEKEKALLLSNSNVIENQYKKYDFEKIYLSYRRYVNKNEYDNEIKASIRLNTIKVMEDKKITNYKIYKMLKLNPGNISDYLTNGNVKKVSLLTTKKIYEFCLSQ